MKEKKLQRSAEPLLRCLAEQPPQTIEMRHRRRRWRQKRIYLLMVLTLLLLALVAIAFVLIPQFIVDEIIVEGNSYYTSDAIIEASGIGLGDEIISVFMSDIDENAFYASCPYVRSVTVTCGFSKVWIRVDEVEDLMYTSDIEGNWYALDTDLRVWQKASTPAPFRDFLRVRLPAFYPAERGGKISFVNGSLTYDYIGELIRVLKEQNVLSAVDYINYSDKFSVSFVFGGRVRLELGAVADLEEKLSRFAYVLSEKSDTEYAVIDVSDPDRSLYRTVSGDDIYR